MASEGTRILRRSGLKTVFAGFAWFGEVHEIACPNVWRLQLSEYVPRKNPPV